MFDASTRVLVVDDMKTMRKIVIKALHAIGLTDVIEAGDGAEGWTVLNDSEKPVGLIVSDWNMPNSTGLDFLKRVRADSRFSKLPFLMVTAEREKEQIAEAIKSGVSNYVVKPFTPDTIKEKLEQTYKNLYG